MRFEELKGATQLVLSGEIDVYQVEAVNWQAITERLKGIQALQVNLGAVTFLDSTGIGFLVRLHTERPVTLVDVPPRVVRILDVLGLTSVFIEASPSPDTLP